MGRSSERVAGWVPGADMGQHADSSALRAGDLVPALKFAVLLAFAAIIASRFVHNVNWDEFYFLGHVHAAADGRLTLALQTAFVHAFAWLPALPGNEIEEIIAGRLVVTTFLALTCWSIWRIVHSLGDPVAAWVAVFAFLMSGFVMGHGASFRADPFVTGFLMVAVATIMTTDMRGGAILIVAVCSALGLLVTIKAGLYLPVYLGALYWRSGDRGVIGRILLAGALAVVLAGGLFILHAMTVASSAEGVPVSGGMRSAFSVTLLSGDLLPRGEELMLWAKLSLPALVLAAIGIARSGSRRLALVLILFALPLASAVIYRNAWPYWFAFATPPLMVAVGLGAARLRDSRALLVLLVLALGFGAWQAERVFRETMGVQKDTVAEVHRLFPEPVPYIDRNAMIASFPREGFFMSTWGIAAYQARGLPELSEIIVTQMPPLVLANAPALHNALVAPDHERGAFGLLPTDRRKLHESYVHHAGVIWLAGGKVIGLGAEVVRLTVPFTGRYRFRAETTVTLDGVQVAPGEVVTLAGGSHKVVAPEGVAVALLWATDAPLDAVSIRPGPLYHDFWR